MSTTTAPRFAHLSDDTLYAALRPLEAPDVSVANWAGAFVSTPRKVFEPETYEHCALVLELARRSGIPARAIGVVHSPSDLALTSGWMIRMLKLNKVLEVDVDKHLVTVQGGIVLAELEKALASYGLGLRNCGSISEQTLAGVIATATHGSGLNFGVMSMHVRALELMLADGSITRCSRSEDPDLFMASLCGLGATGLILSVTLDVEPAFNLKDHQYSVPFDEAVTRLPEIVPSAEHFRAWWFPQADSVRLSMCNRTEDSVEPAGSWLWDSLCGYHIIQLLLFIGRFFPAVNAWTARFAAWLVSSPSVGVDKSMNIFNVDCRYQQYTTEWSIPYENTQLCLRDLDGMFKAEFSDPNGLRPHFPIEIRFSGADDIWLSPSNGQRSCWIGIIQFRPYGFAVPYRRIFEKFERIMLRHAGRPHWAKAHPLRPVQLREMYPRLDDFVAVLRRVDPAGLLRNPYVERHLFGVSDPSVADRVFKERP